MLQQQSRRRKRRFSLGQAIILLVLILIFIVVAYPFFYVLSLAVMPYSAYIRQPIHAWPAGFSLEYFQQILSNATLVQGFEISILKTVLGTALEVTITILAGYALSRPQLKHGRLLTFLFLIPLFVNAGLIPYYLVVRATGLLNTFWALLIPGTVFSFYLYIVRAYYLEYPMEVIEAATVDGANQFTTFWRVILPTSTPIIATSALLFGIQQWNDYFWPSILVQPNLYSATVILRDLVTNRDVLQGLGVGLQTAPESFVAAVAAIVIIPVLVVYPFLQRHVIQGLMVGSLKG